MSGLWERVGPGGANLDFDALQSADGGPPAATFWALGAGRATKALRQVFTDGRPLPEPGLNLQPWWYGYSTGRFRRPNFGTLQIDITIEETATYAKFFNVRVNQRLIPDAELIEFICNENEKSVRYYDP